MINMQPTSHCIAKPTKDKKRKQSSLFDENRVIILEIYPYMYLNLLWNQFTFQLFSEKEILEWILQKNSEGINANVYKCL